MSTTADLTKLIGSKYHQAKEDVLLLSTEDLIILAAAAIASARMLDDDIDTKEMIDFAKRNYETS